MTKKELLDLLRYAILDRININYNDNESFEINIKGRIKDMVAKKEKGFNETQLKQIAEIVMAIINETIIPRLDRIERCPTIARELKELENN